MFEEKVFVVEGITDKTSCRMKTFVGNNVLNGMTIGIRGKNKIDSFVSYVDSVCARKHACAIVSNMLSISIITDNWRNNQLCYLLTSNDRGLRSSPAPQKN